MVNKDRIVPVQAIDLISLYATILKAAGTTVYLKGGATPEGDFVLGTVSGAVLANEPVRKFDLEEATSQVVYFVPAYDFDGFYADDSKYAIAAEIDADGCTLYKATLADSAVTVVKVGL